MGKLKEEEENKGRRERQQAGERRSGTKHKKTFSFCFVFCLVDGEEISRNDQNPDGLTATIMMQLSRNPKPTKGRALCSKTGGRTTNKNALH